MTVSPPLTASHWYTPATSTETVSNVRVTVLMLLVLVTTAELGRLLPPSLVQLRTGIPSHEQSRVHSSSTLFPCVALTTPPCVILMRRASAVGQGYGSMHTFISHTYSKTSTCYTNVPWSNVLQTTIVT